MSDAQRVLAVAALSVVSVGGILASDGSAFPEASPWSSWAAIRLEARPLLLFWGRTEMMLSEAPGRKLLETRSRATFLGAEVARSRTLTTIDAASGRTMEYWELSKERGRRYTFGADGYVVEKLRPGAGPNAPVERWQAVSRREFSYPPASGEERPRVFDYYGMLLHLRDAALRRPGDEVILHVATSKGPQPYRIRVSEERRSRRTVGGFDGNGSRPLEVRELRLRICPADPSRADEGFMKMEGETEIWVEADTRTVLEIDGRIPGVPGRVELRLVAIKRS